MIPYMRTQSRLLQYELSVNVLKEAIRVVTLLLTDQGLAVIEPAKGIEESSSNVIMSNTSTDHPF